MSDYYFDDVLSQVQDQVRRASDGLETGAELPRVETEAFAYDHRISVVMAGGQVSRIAIQAAAMRLSNVELAEYLVEAVNAAITAHSEAMVAATTDTRTDFGALQHDLRALSDSAQRSMSSYLGEMQAMLTRVEAR